jgi:hypothetical protein
MKKTSTKSKAKVTKKVTKQPAKSIKIQIDKEKFKTFAKSAGKIVGLLLILLLVDLFVQYLNNDYSVAIVNGKRIPRREYINNLENIYGKQMAESMIEEELVQQLALEEEVSVDDEDIDKAYEKIANQMGGEEALKSALKNNNMTEEQLKEQLENELLLQEIIRPTLEYTDEDLGKFFEEYKEFLFEDASDVNFEDKKDTIEEYYIEQKTYEARDGIIEDFKKDVSIQINVAGSDDEVKYGFFKATRNLISNLIDQYNTN